MKPISHRFLSLLATLMFFMGAIHLARIRSVRWFALRSIKSISEGIAPVIALASAGTALFAVVLRMPYAGLAAAAGALLSIRYILRIARTKPDFAAAFGDDWQAQLESRLVGGRQAALLRKQWTWKMPAPTVEPYWVRDTIYHTVSPVDGGNTTELRCDLWQPGARMTTTGLAVIYIHGGGYFTSSKDFGTRPFFRHLAGQGHTIMDIDYRLAPAANLLDMLSDVRHAVAWMKMNAERLGVDPQRIVLAGGSAGAQLALLAAYAPNPLYLSLSDPGVTDLSVRAVVSYYGIVDMAAAYLKIQSFFDGVSPPRPVPDDLVNTLVGSWAGGLAARVRGVDREAMRIYLRQNSHLMQAGLATPMRALIGGTPDEIPELYQAVSPLHLAGPHCPPTLLIQGEHDYLLPVEKTRTLHGKLSEAGVPVVMVELPETDHTFDLFFPRYSPAAQTAMYYLERFLALVM